MLSSTLLRVVAAIHVRVSRLGKRFNLRSTSRPGCALKSATHTHLSLVRSTSTVRALVQLNALHSQRVLHVRLFTSPDCSHMFLVDDPHKRRVAEGSGVAKRAGSLSTPLRVLSTGWPISLLRNSQLSYSRDDRRVIGKLSDFGMSRTIDDRNSLYGARSGSLNKRRLRNGVL